MLRSAASPGSVGFGRFGGGTSGLLMTPPPTGHLYFPGWLDRPNLQMVAAKCEGRPGCGRPCVMRTRTRLLDLRFSEFDVLLRDRIIFLLDQLVGHSPRILAGHVIETGVGARHELHLDGGGLCHGQPRSR